MAVAFTSMLERSTFLMRLPLFAENPSIAVHGVRPTSKATVVHRHKLAARNCNHGKDPSRGLDAPQRVLQLHVRVDQHNDSQFAFDDDVLHAGPHSREAVDLAPQCRVRRALALVLGRLLFRLFRATFRSVSPPLLFSLPMLLLLLLLLLFHGIVRPTAFVLP